MRDSLAATRGEPVLGVRPGLEAGFRTEPGCVVVTVRLPEGHDWGDYDTAGKAGLALAISKALRGQAEVWTCLALEFVGQAVEP